MQNRKINDEKYEDYVHPKNQETIDMFESAILVEYNKQCAEEE